MLGENNMESMEDKYLPPTLRDFHNQKDVFKGMNKFYEGFIKNLPYAMDNNLKNLSWVDLHILTIDFILWHLAKQGYVLRKNDKFKDERYIYKNGNW